MQAASDMNDKAQQSNFSLCALITLTLLALTTGITIVFIAIYKNKKSQLSLMPQYN